MKRKFYILLGCLILMVSCIEEYKLPSNATETYKEELVIQGRILSGEKSAIYISQTSPFGKGQGKSIETAIVTIVGQNGYESEVATYENQHSHYIIDTTQLPPNTLYAVKVIWDGETYQSDFQELQVSPEIDEITYKETNDGISIHVSTHDAEDGRRAYMWTYEEDWEFHSDINIFSMGAPILYNNKLYSGTASDNPYYYCWGHNDSYNIYIYSTENLRENRVAEHQLFEIPIDDIRISYIYSVLVKQWSLSNDAYNYFRIQKLYTEESSGLFTPMPTEIYGNVKCISNPDIKVRGYVLAATITSKRIFIYEKDLNNPSEYGNCRTSEPDPLNGYWTRWWMEYINEGKAIAVVPTASLDLYSTLYYQECFDCRKTEGATKKRPDFWPNNHE